MKNQHFDLVERLRKRAEIRRQINTRKSVQNNEPDRLADLLEEAANALEEKQMKQEPIAWMYYDDWKKLKLAQTMPPDANMFPVYTAPRELSDEEILQIAFERHARIPKNIGNDMLLISFARAILKKASEK